MEKGLQNDFDINNLFIPGGQQTIIYEYFINYSFYYKNIKLRMYDIQYINRLLEHIDFI